MHNDAHQCQEVFAGRFNTALPPPNALTICGRLGNAGARAALGALSYQAAAFGHCAPPNGGGGG